MSDDHHRVTPLGRAYGLQLARMVEPVIKHLEANGEPDERCKSCAFRAGTVPNGCLQTIADAIKAMLEQKHFLCHVNHYENGQNRLCAGWLASQWGSADREPVACSWDFSPPDEVEPQA